MAISLGDVFVFLKGNKEHLDRTLGGAERDIQGFGSRISGFLQNSLSFVTGDLITGAFNKIISAVGSLKEGMIGGNTAFEQYATQFKVLIGNADLAQKRMEELADFGARTPFELPQVVEADRVLQGFGLHVAGIVDRFGKSGEEIRTIAGDVAAGTGSSFQEMAALIGRFSAGATGEAISRMQELGITTRKELAGLGLEFAKSGELISPLDEAMTVLLQVMQDRFGGMMDAQSQTFGGMLSNFQDWMSQVARTLGEPVFDVLKQGLTAFLDFVKPGSPADTVIKEFSSTIRLTLGVLGEIAQALVGDAAGQINGFVQSVAEGLQKVNAFLRQLKDEIAGLTAGDILAELGPGLEQMHSQMQQSLDQLAATHEATLATLEGQIQNAGERMGQAMAEIAEKYGPKILQLEERLTDTRTSFEERLTDAAEAHAKKKLDIEKQIAKSTGDLEEKLTQLKRDHQRRRQQLTMSLLTAESEEEYLRIKSQIAAEDDKFKEQTDAAKKANKEQVDTLKDRLKEEDAQHTKQENRLKAQRDKAIGDLQKQLDEIKGKRAEEEAEVQAIYNKEVEMLHSRISAENAAYAQQQADIKAMFEQQMADFEAEISARVAAIGSGPAAQVGAFIRGVIDEFHRFKEVVGEFIDQYATPLIGVLIGIGAVLLGGGVIAAVSALAAALSGVALPVLAVIGAVALLYTAWTENWGGIQEKTAAVLEWLSSTIQSTLDGINQWWDEHGAAVDRIINQIGNIIQAGLALIEGIWRTHGDVVTENVSLGWESVKAIFENGKIVLTEGIEALADLLEGNWSGFFEHMRNISEAGWNAMVEVFGNSKEQLVNIAGELVEAVTNIFTGFDGMKIGKAMIDGLLEGFKTGLAKLKDLARSAIQDTTAAAQDEGEIDSPSKKMSREVGKPLGQGVGVGFAAEMANLKRTVAGGLAGLAPGALAGAAAGPTTNLISLSQTNHMPAAPAGFDRESLLNDVDQRTIKLLMEHYEDD